MIADDYAAIARAMKPEPTGELERRFVAVDIDRNRLMQLTTADLDSLVCWLHREIIGTAEP